MITFVDEESEKEIENKRSPDDEMRNGSPVIGVKGYLSRNNNYEGSESRVGWKNSLSPSSDIVLTQSGIIVEIPSTMICSIVQSTVWNEEDHKGTEHSMENRINEDSHIEEEIELAGEIEFRVP